MRKSNATQACVWPVGGRQKWREVPSRRRHNGKDSSAGNNFIKVKVND